MRKAGAPHILGFERARAQSLAAAAMAEKQAQIAQYNERANRVRIQRLEAWAVQVSEFLAGNETGNGATVPKFVAPEVVEFDEDGKPAMRDVAETTNSLDTEGNAVQNSEAE